MNLLGKLYYKSKSLNNKAGFLLLSKIYKTKLAVGFGVKVGKHFDLVIQANGRVDLKENVTFRDFARVYAIDGTITIGSNSFFNNNVTLDAHEEIEIGENCLFGPNVSVFDNNHNYQEVGIPIIRQGFNYGKVRICNNVWIGANSVVTAGVTIGDNVIVGANSVVTKDLAPGGVYAGVPAKRIKEFPTG